MFVLMKGPEVKKKRKVIYLLEKVEVLYVKLDKGMRITAVRLPLWWPKIDSFCHKKNKASSEEALGQMLHKV
jgi:hypothetical protein